LLDESFQKLGKLSVVWRSSNLDDKRRIQKTLFPEGIFYDAENHIYLTDRPNEFLTLIDCVTKEWTENKKGNSQVDLENSPIVPRRGIEFASRVAALFHI